MKTPALCQIEMKTPDVGVSLAFVREVFGWEASPIEMHDYTVIHVPDDCPYGLAFIRSPMEKTSPQNTVYFRVDDAEGTLLAAQRAGGKCRFGPKRVPGLGTLYHIEDPLGLVYGIFVPDSSAENL